MRISLSKTSIFEEAAKIAAYSGKAKAEKAEAPENTYRSTAMQEEYRELLDKVMERSCLALTDAASRMNATLLTEREDDCYVIEADMPYNWNHAVLEELESSAEAYAIHSVAAKWARLIGSGNEERFAADAADDLLVFGRLLRAKRRVGRSEFIAMSKARRKENNLDNHRTSSECNFPLDDSGWTEEEETVSDVEPISEEDV